MQQYSSSSQELDALSLLPELCGRVVEMMSKVKESFINHSEWSRNKRMRMMLLQWHFSPFNMHLQLLQCLLSLQYISPTTFFNVTKNVFLLNTHQYEEPLHFGNFITERADKSIISSKFVFDPSYGLHGLFKIKILYLDRILDRI